MATFLSILVMSIIGFLLFSILKVYVFDKIKINKWIVLVLAIVIVILPGLLGIDPNGFLNRYVFTTIYVILFLWFIDLCGFFKRIEQKGQRNVKPKNPYERKNRENYIKPKAKKNRRD